MAANEKHLPEEESNRGRREQPHDQRDRAEVAVPLLSQLPVGVLAVGESIAQLVHRERPHRHEDRRAQTYRHLPHGGDCRRLPSRVPSEAVRL